MKRDLKFFLPYRIVMVVFFACVLLTCFMPIVSIDKYTEYKFYDTKYSADYISSYSPVASKITPIDLMKNLWLDDDTLEIIKLDYAKFKDWCDDYYTTGNWTKEEYEELIQKKISNIINKTRIIVPIDENLKVEIDIYYEYLDGLLTAEIEFPSEEIARTYKEPMWLGKELGYKELSNRKLAEMTKEEFRSKVSEEFINQNRKLINKLNKII